ncbi:DMT family transporter [Ruminococcaceae bacterium OttesenSCG-928-I18]|nr:DMT family transporter [Ruminococcaceae bacterium OttesenSCG-928-I18]
MCKIKIILFSYDETNDTLIVEKLQPKRVTVMIKKWAEPLLILVNVAMGSSFILMKLGLGGVSTFALITLRFSIAFLLLWLLFSKRLRKVKKQTLLYGAILGFTQFWIFTFYLSGIKSTSASSAGFLASTTVVCVPILQAILQRKFPRTPVLLSVGLTMLGVGLITIRDSFTIESGSVLCMLGAMAYAVHITVANRLINSDNSLQLGVYQLGFAGFYGLVAMLIFEQPALPSTPTAWFAILAMAVICSAFGNALQPTLLRYVPVERVGVFVALEPLSSALFGFVFLHEVLEPKAYVGAAIILAGILISGWKPRQHAPAKV